MPKKIELELLSLEIKACNGFYFRAKSSKKPLKPLILLDFLAIYSAVFIRYGNKKQQYLLVQVF